MSNSAILKSSLTKKYWMALTGLFLCLFLVGHLIGNLQLIFKTGEDGRRAFNEYAYFMQHNPAIKVLSYLTYISILFHSVDGFLLAFQNRKARPQKYAHSSMNSNSNWNSRNMAFLGTFILIFIVTHMVNFWAKMHFTEMPLHTVKKTQEVTMGQDQMGRPVKGEISVNYALLTNGQYTPVSYTEESSHTTEKIMNQRHTEFFAKDSGLKVGEGYKDLHAAVFGFFGRENPSYPVNEYALLATILYVLSMVVLAFHLAHGFRASFQSLGMRHPKYTPFIKGFGLFFAYAVSFAFAIIPVLIYARIV